MRDYPCDVCGEPSTYHPLIEGGIVDLCDNCYANEFPERAAVFHLNRVTHGSAGEIASREEQHGYYLDCGPEAWDDR